jgi:hypothetical protein
MFRPELVGVRLGAEAGTEGAMPAASGALNALRARVSRIDFTGDHLKVYFETPDGAVTGKLPPDLILSQDSEVTLLIKAENCVAQ